MNYTRSRCTVQSIVNILIIESLQPVFYWHGIQYIVLGHLKHNILHLCQLL